MSAPLGQRRGCSWCNDTGEVGPPEDRYVCPCPAGQLLTLRAQQPAMNENMREAWKLTHGDRRAAYGTPAQVFAGYALMWSGLLAKKLQPGVLLTAGDVTLMMTALKLAREANAPGKDNIVDAHGYLIMHDEAR